MLKILKSKMENLRLFFLKIFFPSKYELYLKRKIEEEFQRFIEEKKREEERKNIEKFAMVGGKEFVDKDPITKRTKIDNIGQSLTFYLKKKKGHGRGTVVVKGTSFEDVEKQYGEEYDFMEPMIKHVDDEY